MEQIQKKYPPAKYLYRGSLFYKKRLYPRLYKNGKKYIFTTSNIYLAISYIRKNNAMIAQSDENNIVRLYELEFGEFKKALTTPGYLYILDKNKFEKSNLKNLETEYFSTQIQEPVKIIHIKNPLSILQKTNNVILKEK